MSEVVFNQAAAFEHERFFKGHRADRGGDGRRGDDLTLPDLSLALVNYPDLMALQIPERARHLRGSQKRRGQRHGCPRGIGKTFLGCLPDERRGSC